MRQLERRYFKPARERHGEARWNEALTTGGNLAPEKAIGLALCSEVALAGPRST